MTSLPRPSGRIAAAWAAAIGAQVAGVAALANHDSLLTGDRPPFVAAALIALLAWQVMIAAMMLPSSLPLIRLYARATERAPRRGSVDGRVPRRLRADVERLRAGGLQLRRQHPRRGRLSSVAPAPRLVDRWHVLALAGAFQFSSLKDACLRQCRHPRQFLTRYYGAARRRLEAGRPPRRLLRGLLLGPDAGDVRRRRGQPALDGALTAVMVDEKTRPMGSKGGPRDGRAFSERPRSS